MANARMQLSDDVWRKVKTTAVNQNTTASSLVDGVLRNYFNPEAETYEVKTPWIKTPDEARVVADRITARPVPKPAKRSRPRPKTLDVKAGEVSEW